MVWSQFFLKKRGFFYILALGILPLFAFAQESAIEQQERAGTAKVREKTGAPTEQRSEIEFGKIQINPDFKITKVHSFVNDPRRASSRNLALDFERKYWNWGGVTSREAFHREGHYFVITWVSRRTEPGQYRTRFEYRQEKSKEKIRILELSHQKVKGSVRSTFAVLGEAFRTYGDVFSWRFTVLDGNKVVAQETSFIW